MGDGVGRKLRKALQRGNVGSSGVVQKLEELIGALELTWAMRRGYN